ncbi:hypothetical protein ACLB2K_018177 [Fragaria x ananassa]
MTRPGNAKSGSPNVTQGYTTTTDAVTGVSADPKVAFCAATYASAVFRSLSPSCKLVCLGPLRWPMFVERVSTVFKS